MYCCFSSASLIHSVLSKNSTRIRLTASITGYSKQIFEASCCACDLSVVMVWEFSRDRPDQLLEVFSISMFSGHISDIRNVEIEGSVQVRDIVNRPMDMFKSKDDATNEEVSTILPDGTLHLTGPMRGIVASVGLVDLSLKDKHRDFNLSDGTFHMSPYVRCVPFDQRVTTLVPGKHGHALVHFVLYSAAVEAIVEVSLVSVDDLITSPKSSLYGSIWACNDFHEDNCPYDREYFKSTLFHATKERPKEPSHVSNSIPLSRSVVAVPMGSNLIIKAQLFDATTEASIVDDTAYFVAETSGSPSQRIGGIITKVNWLVDPFSTPGAEADRPRSSTPSHLPRKRSK